MDSSWEAITSWLIFLPAAGAIGYYYWNGSNRRKPVKGRENVQQTRSADEKKARKTGPSRQQVPEPAVEKAATTSTGKEGKSQDSGRNASKRAQKLPQDIPDVAVQEDPGADDSEMSTRAFVERMQKAKQGTNLSTPASHDKRVKTVKTSSAMASPLLSDAEQGAEADGESSPSSSGAMHAGDVSDMLEPKPVGPSTLRILPSEKSQKQAQPKQKKEELVETKKQRQNRKKKEAEQAQRQADEVARKALENSQRRAAREARNEPAKDGSRFMAAAPTNNPWAGKNAAAEAEVTSAPVVNGTSAPPLLDTFDAESTSSSNGMMEGSTAATSTTGPSEEEQMAQAMKQSGDESGWNTVAKPKKQKKKVNGEVGDGDVTPVEVAKPVVRSAPSSKPASEKPKGFLALEDEYKQRADVDPTDASNWDA